VQVGWLLAASPKDAPNWCGRDVHGLNLTESILRLGTVQQFV